MANWLLQICAVAILFTIIGELIPDSETKKLALTVMSICMTVILLRPIINLGGSEFNIKEHMNSILSMTQGLEGTAGETVTAEILDDYVARCCGEISAKACTVSGVAKTRTEVIIDRNVESEAFAQLQHVYVYLTFMLEESGTESNTESWIEPIIIGSVADTSDEREKSAIMASVTEVIAAWLETDVSCVTVFEEAEQ